jgi:hypothetical protein
LAHSSTFDTTKFIDILSTEVRDIAQTRYKGTSRLALGKAFQFWCIKNISTQLSDDDAELARSRCEGGPAGDENIDGAWIDPDPEKKTFFLMQSKYSPPNANVYSEDFKIESFGSQAAEELDAAFRKMSGLALRNEAGMPRKLLELIKLYREALAAKHRVELIVTISGNAKKSLLEKVAQINDEFRGDTKYEKHHVSIYDVDELRASRENRVREDVACSLRHRSSRF